MIVDIERIIRLRRLTAPRVPWRHAALSAVACPWRLPDLGWRRCVDEGRPHRVLGCVLPSPLLEFVRILGNLKSASFFARTSTSLIGTNGPIFDSSTCFRENYVYYGNYYYHPVLVLIVLFRLPKASCTAPLLLCAAVPTRLSTPARVEHDTAVGDIHKHAYCILSLCTCSSGVRILEQAVCRWCPGQHDGTTEEQLGQK